MIFILLRKSTYLTLKKPTEPSLGTTASEQIGQSSSFGRLGASGESNFGPGAA